MLAQELVGFALDREGLGSRQLRSHYGEADVAGFFAFGAREDRPEVGLGYVFLHTATDPEIRAQSVLRTDVALLGRFQIPLHGEEIVLRDIFTSGVTSRQCRLLIGIANFSA